MGEEGFSRGRVAFSHSRMFNHIVREEDVCQRLIERILGLEIESLEFYTTEHSIVPAINSHGVRLDVYARGATRAFDVEMQMQREYYIGLRMRYYQSAIDCDLLRKGSDYSDLLRTYVIFLCKDDCLGYGLPVYTIEPCCREDVRCDPDARMTWIVLNGSAWRNEESKDLRALLQYIGEETVTEGDSLVEKIDRLVSEANEDKGLMSEMESVSTVEENAERRVRMAEKYYREVGVEEGRAEGERRLSALISHLMEAGRANDVVAATSDPAARAELYAEFGL